jgi:hypothetical protein
VIGIDKGQAFKFFETDNLDWDYNPNAGFTNGSWYNKRLKRWTNGEDIFWAAPDHPELRSFIERIQNLSDDDFKAILKPYVEKAFRAPGFAGRRTGLPFDDVDKFYAAALARKNGIGQAFEDQYQRALAQRNKKLGIAFKPAAQPDVLTPITPAFVTDVIESGWQGKSLLLGGEDVENMTGLVYKIEGDGTAIDLKIRAGAEAKLFARIGGMPTGSAVIGATADDPHAALWEKVKKVAISYNHHLKPGADGVIPPHTQAEIGALAALFRKDPQNPVYKHYAGLIYGYDAEITGKKTLGGMKGIKAEQYIAPSPPPEPRRESDRRRSPSRFDVKPETYKTLEVVNEGGAIRLVEGRSRSYNAHGVEIVFDNDITAHYTQHGNGNDQQYSKQGLMRIIITGDLTDEKLKRVTEYMGDLGLDGRLATKQDVELMYLIKTTYAAGYDPSAIDMQAAGIGDRIKAFQGFWNKKLQVEDVTKLASYHPDPFYDTPAPNVAAWRSGGAVGAPRWRRFDISEADLDREMPGFGLVHSIYGGDLLATVRLMLQHNGGLVASEEKQRIGLGGGGMSPDADMRTGGASYVFTRIASEAKTKSGSYQFVFDKKLLLDTDAISYGGDMFGRKVDGFVKTGGRA